MNIKQISLVTVVLALILSRTTNAVLGPIPIYLNTEYRTEVPIIGSISSTLSFNTDEIKATGAGTFLEFLDTIPAVGLVDSQGNIPAIFMRGNEAGHTLVLVDGVGVNDISSVSGAVGYGLKNISLNDIEKVEIVKGSGSVLYGSSAISGVIVITTKKGVDGKNSSVNLKYGTNNSKTYSLSVNDGSKDGFVRFTHNTYKTDGINARTDDDTGDKDGVDNQATQIKFGNENFNISYLENRNKTEYDNCWNGSAYVDNCLSDRKLNKLAISANKKINDTWNAKLSIAKSKNNVSTYEGGVVSIYSSDDYKSTNITLLNDIKINSALFNIGLSKIEDNNITDNQQFSSTNVFIDWQKNVKDFDFNTGLRYIKHGEFGSHTVYNIGIGKNLSNNIKLTANHNSAFKAPSLYQAFAPDNITKLEPETSKNINISLNKKYSWGDTRLELYKNTINDMIAYKGWLKYANEDKLTTKGAEVSLNASVASYNISLTHNYNNSKLIELNESPKQSTRRPKNITNLELSKQYGKYNSKVQVITKSSSLISNREEVNGYTLINLSSGYNINDNAKISLNINNATDKNYEISGGNNYRYIQPGRTFTIGLDYSF